MVWSYNRHKVVSSIGRLEQVIIYLCLYMFGLTMNLTKSGWHGDFEVVDLMNGDYPYYNHENVNFGFAWH